MREYTPQVAPANVDSYVQRELQEISEASTGFAEVLRLRQRHNAPSRPRIGMIVLADGTNWNPGDGEGFYGYYDGSWHKLG